jgi:hypothetical protein
VKGFIAPPRSARVRALPLLAAALLPLLSLAQPSGPLLLLTPTAASLNVTANEVAPLTFILQNLGGGAAVNVTVTLAASGCAQLLGWNSTWETKLALNLGDLAPGSAKRILIPVRCRGGSGSVLATAYADNADPAYAAVRVSAREGSWPPALIPAAAVAALAAPLYALHRARRRAKRPAEKRRGRSSGVGGRKRARV